MHYGTLPSCYFFQDGTVPLPFHYLYDERRKFLFEKSNHQIGVWSEPEMKERSCCVEEEVINVNILYLLRNEFLNIEPTYEKIVGVLGNYFVMIVLRKLRIHLHIF